MKDHIGVMMKVEVQIVMSFANKIKLGQTFSRETDLLVCYMKD